MAGTGWHFPNSPSGREGNRDSDVIMLWESPAIGMQQKLQAACVVLQSLPGVEHSSSEEYAGVAKYRSERPQIRGASS